MDKCVINTFLFKYQSMIAMQKLDEEKLHSFECTHIFIVKQLVKADAGPLQAVLHITWMNIYKVS